MSHADGLTVAVVGATGAVGRDLLNVLERATLPIAAFRLFASPASNGEVVEVRDRAHRVQALPSNDGIPAVFEGVDLVFMAAPANVSRGLMPLLQDEFHRKYLLDCDLLQGMFLPENKEDMLLLSPKILILWVLSSY